MNYHCCSTRFLFSYILHALHPESYDKLHCNQYSSFPPFTSNNACVIDVEKKNTFLKNALPEY